MSDETWLTPRQVADLLQVNISTVRARIRDGTLKAHRVRRSRLLRIRRGDVEALLVAEPVGAADEAGTRLKAVR